MRDRPVKDNIRDAKQDRHVFEHEGVEITQLNRMEEGVVMNSFYDSVKELHSDVALRIEPLSGYEKLMVVGREATSQYPDSIGVEAVPGFLLDVSDAVVYGKDGELYDDIYIGDEEGNLFISIITGTQDLAADEGVWAKLRDHYDVDAVLRPEL